jgi:hypothetical protein
VAEVNANILSAIAACDNPSIVTHVDAFTAFGGESPSETPTIDSLIVGFQNTVAGQVDLHPTSQGEVVRANLIYTALTATTAPTLTTPYVDLINLNTDVVAGVDLNTNISGETSLVVTWDPAIPSGLSETAGVVSGTVTTPTGTSICTVTGTNSFGSISDKFQWTTLTTGAASNINTTIND